MLECLIKTEDKNQFKKISDEKIGQMQTILKDSKKYLNVITIKHIFFKINSFIKNFPKKFYLRRLSQLSHLTNQQKLRVT